LCSKVANSAFLEPDFEILAFLEIKNVLTYLQSGGLGSDKTLSELHIHYKTMQGAQNIARILPLP